jgi:hypothetical protein
MQDVGGIAYTKPWNAPEYDGPLPGTEVMKTDVYSFGMLFWRSITNNGPFSEISLRPSYVDQLEDIEALKLSEHILSFALSSSTRYCPTPKEFEIVRTILNGTLRFDPKLRKDFRELKATFATDSKLVGNAMYTFWGLKCPDQ